MTTRQWKFLTNHALVLATVAEVPDVRVADISSRVRVTERACHGILKDLESAGYVTITRVGRRNTYRVNEHLPLRHPTTSHAEIKTLLDLVGGG